MHEFAANADSIGLGAKPTAESVQHAPAAAQALAGSNRDVVHNRRAIRMANLSAAEVLKAELAGLSPVKSSASKSALPSKPVERQPAIVTEIPGLGSFNRNNAVVPVRPVDMDTSIGESDMDADGEPDPDAKVTHAINSETNEEADISIGTKRKFEEGPGTGVNDVIEDVVTIEDDDEPAATPALKVNADGTVEQEDTVK